MLGDDLRWVPTDWHAIGSVTGLFELEWQRSLEDLDDGSLAIRHEGRTILTIDGIDNDREALDAVAVAELEGERVVVDLKNPVR